MRRIRLAVHIHPQHAGYDAIWNPGSPGATLAIRTAGDESA